MNEQRPFRPGKGKLLAAWSCRRRWRHAPAVPGSPPARRTALPAVLKAVAVLTAVAIPLSAVQPVKLTDTPLRLASAQQQAEAAASAFEASPFTDTTPLPAAQRSEGLPADPSSGFTLQDGPQGTVKLIAAHGIGAGHTTASGYMIYPDTGAGYTLIAGRTPGRHSHLRATGWVQYCR